MFQNVDKTGKQARAAGLRRNAWAIAAVACFLLCAGMSLLLPATPFMLFPFLIGVAATLYCVFRIKDRSLETPYRVVVNGDPLDLDAIAASLPEGFEVRGLPARSGEWTGFRSYVASDGFDEKLRSYPLAYEVPEGKFQFEDLELLPYVGYLKEHRNFELGPRVGNRPDKAVMGLDSDLTLESFNGKARLVALSRNAVQVTDDAFSKVVVDTRRITGKAVYFGRACCIGEDGSLAGIDEATNANQLDVGVIAISSDGVILTTRAGDDHPLCPGDLCPSAMSSVSPADIGSATTLQEIVVSTAKRKLRAAYGLGPDDISCSVMGYARILAVGAAPEFYCIARLSKTHGELSRSHSDDVAAISDAVFPASSIDELISSLERLGSGGDGPVSISLDAGIRCMLSAAKQPEGRRVLENIISGKGAADA